MAGEKFERKISADERVENWTHGYDRPFMREFRDRHPELNDRVIDALEEAQSKPNERYPDLLHDYSPHYDVLYEAYCKMHEMLTDEECKRLGLADNNGKVTHPRNHFLIQGG